MSINYVQIVPADEKYAPPSEIIELAVVEDDTDQLVHAETEEGREHFTLRHARKLVCLSLSEYSETNKGSTITRKVEFPAMDLNDLIRALGVFGIAGQAWHIGGPPVQLPPPPVPES